MRIFLLGSGGKYPSFLYQCTNASEGLGHETKAFDYRFMKLHRLPATNKILNKLIEKKVAAYNPDLLLVLKGETIQSGTIRNISKKGIKTANWTLDSPFGDYYPENKIRNLGEYDYFFSFDPHYLDKLKEIVQKSYYLPCAADPEVHKEIIPFEKRRYNSDISFIGSYEPEREELAEDLRGYDFNIWGPGWKRAKNLPEKYHKEFLFGKKMCRQFNLSKINLNIQALHGKESMNLRTFEIPSTKSFQLVDYKKELPNLFNIKKEVAVYHDTKEMKDMIDYYLDNPEERNKISEAGQKRVLKEHTVRHRIKELVSKTGI